MNEIKKHTDPFTGAPVDLHLTGSDGWFETASGTVFPFEVVNGSISIPLGLFEEQYTDIDAAAEFLGVSRQRVQTLINTGKIQAFKSPRRINVNLESVRLYAENESRCKYGRSANPDAAH